MNWTFYENKGRYPNGATQMFAAASNLDAYGKFPVLLYFADNSFQWSTSSYIDRDHNWTEAEAPVHRQAPS